jgi:hypothetical protein
MWGGDKLSTLVLISLNVSTSITALLAGKETVMIFSGGMPRFFW